MRTFVKISEILPQSHENELQTIYKMSWDRWDYFGMIFDFCGNQPTTAIVRSWRSLFYLAFFLRVFFSKNEKNRQGNYWQAKYFFWALSFLKKIKQ